MSEQEKDRNKGTSDEPDVEGHRSKAYGDESSEIDAPARRETDEEPDVEAHRNKA
jgi:hypothetical protein